MTIQISETNPQSALCSGSLRLFQRILAAVPAALLLALSVSSLQAQGVLTVTPTPTVALTAGTGTLGFTNNASATAGTLAAPSAVAIDTSGNLYLADTRNHAIRKVVPGGAISTVAGIGIAGFFGDGAAATSAQLDTPTGVAVDANGNLYIADSKNNRIRLVTAGTGVITTIAGTGVAGFSGDSGSATAAALALPSGVAVSADGTRLYIADTNNQRIRLVTGGSITTVAGNGVQGFSGDAAAATAAALDSPVAVALDASGNLYIADRHNQRVRMVTGTTITTLAGSGGGFSGGFSGDGSPATAALLAHPSSVTVDALGNISIVDTNNQRVRKISGTTIATTAGSGVQGASVAGTATASPLNSPTGIAIDASGTVYVADKLNNTAVASTLGTLSLGAQILFTASTPQAITLSNTGTASIAIGSIAFTGPFAGAGGTCAATPFTITGASSCTVNITYTPTAVGAQTGKVTVSGSNVVTTEVALTGSGLAVVPTRLVFTAAPPTSISAGGNAGTVQVALEDGAGNIATTNSVTSVTLTVTTPGGYSQTYTATAANGVASFNLSSVPLTVSATYTYTATATGLTQAAASELVNPGAAASLTVTAPATYTAPQMSGATNVVARDAYGNVATGFTGTVTLTSTDPTATYTPASYMYTAGDAGTHAFTVVFNTAGTYTLTATSSPFSGSQTGIVVRDAIWLLNSTDWLARFSNTGMQTTTAGSSAGPSTAGGIGFDSAGNVWATQRDLNGYVEYSASGTLLGNASNIGGLNAPSAVVIDGIGQAWFANAGNSSLTVLSPGRAALSPATGYTGVTTVASGGAVTAYATPAGIAIDASGNVWVSNAANNTLSEVLGAAAPVVAPIARATATNAAGTRP